VGNKKPPVSGWRFSGNLALLVRPRYLLPTACGVGYQKKKKAAKQFMVTAS
jgi:hypothetical protein